MEVNMRCVICDDNYSDREKIKKIIQMFFSEQMILQKMIHFMILL